MRRRQQAKKCGGGEGKEKWEIWQPEKVEIGEQLGKHSSTRGQGNGRA